MYDVRLFPYKYLSSKQYILHNNTYLYISCTVRYIFNPIYLHGKYFSQILIKMNINIFSSLFLFSVYITWYKRSLLGVYNILVFSLNSTYNLIELVHNNERYVLFSSWFCLVNSFVSMETEVN